MGIALRFLRRMLNTLRDPKAAAFAKLVALPTASVHCATLYETAIDLETDDGTEAGFVLQEYPCGITREAYFFHEKQRVALTPYELDLVASKADAARHTTSITDPSRDAF